MATSAFRPRLWRRRLISSVVGTTIALLLAEVALRVLGLPDTNRLFLSAETFAKDTFVGDADCFWRLSPRHPECNALGLRGPWWNDTKANNELRILAVGDSCTFGFGVDWQDTWAVQLERMVQAAHPDRVVRSGLAALPGYSTFQNRRLLERVLPTAQPDVVAFYCGVWNDFVPAAGASDEELAAQLSASRLLLLVRGLLRPGLDHYRAAFANGAAPQGRRMPLAAFENHLVAMVAACRARGASVVLIAPAHPASTTEQFVGLGEYRDRVIAVAKQSGTPCIDLGEVCRRLDPTGAPPLPGHTTACFLDWVHPAKNLHAALARALADVVGTPLTPGAEPSSLSLLTARERELPVPATGLAPGPLHRVWLGTRPTSATFVRGDLCAAIPDDLPPGEHVLQVVDDTGAHSLGRLVVPPLAMHAERTVRGDVTELVFRGAGTPGRFVLMWAAYERADRTAATPFGDFAMAAPTVHEPVAGIARFDLAVANRHQTNVGADGTWSIAVPVGIDAGAAPRLVFAQALLLDPATLRGALTVVVSIPDRP